MKKTVFYNQDTALRARHSRIGAVSEFKKNFQLFLMVLPGFILTFLFCYLPMFGIIIAFKQYTPSKGFLGSPWCGVENFRFMFQSSEIWYIIRNTILYNLLFIFLGLVIAVGLAIVLNEIRGRIAKKVYQTVLIMPHFLSFVVISYLVFAFLGTEHGLLNTMVLPFLGKAPVNWYVDPKPWPLILTTVHFWKEAGFSSILYTSSIAGINAELYEAAMIDGANRWKQITKVTLPSLKPMIIIMTILNVGKIFAADFGLFYQTTMNSGALYPTTYVFNTYVYNMLTLGGISSVGMASSSAFVQSVLGFILVLSTNLIVKKIDSESSLF